MQQGKLGAFRRGRPPHKQSCPKGHLRMLLPQSTQLHTDSPCKARVPTTISVPSTASCTACTCHFEAFWRQKLSVHCSGSRRLRMAACQSREILRRGKHPRCSFTKADGQGSVPVRFHTRLCRAFCNGCKRFAEPPPTHGLSRGSAVRRGSGSEHLTYWKAGRKFWVDPPKLMWTLSPVLLEI